MLDFLNEGVTSDPLFHDQIVTDPRDVRELLKQQFANVGMQSALPRKDQSERIERCRKNPFLFLPTYLPHRFHRKKDAPPPFADFHYDMWDIPRDVLTLTCGFRESAKSTLLTIGRTIYLFCYGLSNYTLIGSQTETIARRLADPIMSEFESNPYIIGDFGNLVTSRRWSSKEFRLANGPTCEALGIGQTPRGAQASGTSERPDRACLDDLLTTKSAVSEAEYESLKMWIFFDVLPALRSPVDGGYEANINATMIDTRSLIYDMYYDEKEFPNIHRRLYNMMNAEETKSLWPQRFSKADCLHKKATLPLVAWHGEYQMPPLHQGTGLFTQDSFLYYQEVGDQFVETAA